MPISRGRLRTLERFAEVVLPAGGPVPYSAAEMGVAREVAEHVSGLPRRFQTALALALLAWEYSPLWAHRRPFSRLPAAARRRWLEAALRSRFLPWRLIAFWLRMLCVSSYCAQPSVERAIGLTRSCLDESPPRQGERLRPIAYPDIRGDIVEKADAVVIGSGAGGAVVAKELAEAGLSVIVLEEGAYFQRDDYAEGAPWERVSKLYRDAGLTLAWGRPAVPIPMGKAVGGTTVVNSGTCFRAPDSVLRQWERDWGIAGIDPATMDPIFRRVEETISVRPVPWEIIGRNAEVFHRGVEALGYHGQPIQRNIDGCRGCGVCAFGCPSDAKQAMHLSYLPRAAAHGAKIYARCRARRILVEGRRAAGVEADILDVASDSVRGRLRVEASIVALAAGTIHTPALLMANGLALESGQTGRNLRVHPALTVSALFEEEVCAWRGTLQSYYVDELLESHGVLLEATSLLPGVGAAATGEIGDELKEELARYRRVASVGIFVSDSSKGRVVRGLGPNWWTSPIMLYRLNQQDADRLLRGIALAARIYLAAGATAVFTGIPGVPPITDNDGLSPLEKQSVSPELLTLVGFHPMGTCRMGRHPGTSVVGPFGETHSVRGLFVVDASVFPSSVGVNPQVTIMALATRTAFHIVERGL